MLALPGPPREVPQGDEERIQHRRVAKRIEQSSRKGKSPRPHELDFARKRKAVIIAAEDFVEETG